MDRQCERLAAVLREARAYLARPGNCFAWSSWSNAVEALADVDRMLAQLDGERLPERMDMAVLFAPTGPIQEVSVSSGWGEEFLALAARFDAALG